MIITNLKKLKIKKKYSSSFEEFERKSTEHMTYTVQVDLHRFPW